LNEIPNASSHLLRALLGAHAYWPSACEGLILETGSEKKERLLKLIGYGQINDNALYRSLNNTVTLFAEEQIMSDKNHFFELPLPDSLS
jgi:hypothetical protein